MLIPIKQGPRALRLLRAARQIAAADRHPAVRSTAAKAKATRPVFLRYGGKIMNTSKTIVRLLADMTLLGMVSVALAPCAYATPVQIGFNGGGGTDGHASLNVGPDTTAGDPAGAQLIMGASGTFSDASLGFYDVAITGVLARNFAIPVRPDDVPYVPASFSYVPSVGGADMGIAATYDNLFYLAGSPLVCNPDEWPFAGGFLDIFGVMFSLSNGDLVDLWSWGTIPGGSSMGYGMSVLTGSDSDGWTVVDGLYSVRAAVPEPDFLWLFGAAAVGLFAWRRSVETRKRASHPV